MHVRISGAKSLTERRWLAERDDFGAHLPIGIATRGRIRIDGTRTGLPPCSHRAACGTAVDPHDKHSPPSGKSWRHARGDRRRRDIGDSVSNAIPTTERLDAAQCGSVREGERADSRIARAPGSHLTHAAPRRDAREARDPPAVRIPYYCGVKSFYL